MKKIVLLLEEDVDLRLLLSTLATIGNTEVLSRYKDLMKLETTHSAEFIESLDGVRIAEEEVLHYKS